MESLVRSKHALNASTIIIQQRNRKYHTSSPVRHLLPLYTNTKPNSVASPGEYVGDFDYSLQHGAHVVVANATRHVGGPLCENMTSFTKPEENSELSRV